MKASDLVFGACMTWGAIACSATNDRGGGTTPPIDGGDGFAVDGGAFDVGTGPGLSSDASKADAGVIDPDSACLATVSTAHAAPANLLFQIDSSGSMNCPASDSVSASCPASASSRWTVFRTELDKALTTLPDANSVGLMHYPTGKGLFSGDPTGCVPGAMDVDVGLLKDTRGKVSAALAGRTPEGGTPTHDAVKRALASLQAAKLDGNRFLVLATDGNATFCAGCDIGCTSTELATDSETMVADVAAAAKLGIRTFVIGVPGSQGFRSVLSRLAEAGGTSAVAGCSSAGPTYCHYDMTTSADFGSALAAALAAIGGAALSCMYDLPPADGSFDPGKVNVELKSGSSTIDFPRDTSHKDGWDYSADGKSIELYGAACDQAKSTHDGSVALLFGCPTVIR